MKKLLFYSHDSYGLGNIRRMVAIATYLVSRHHDLYILLITGSPMFHAFRTHPQIDYVKLPCLSRNSSGEYFSRLECLNPNHLKSLRAQLIQSTYMGFKPDLCLIDKKPTGLSGELTSIFETDGISTDVKTLLLLRDILDEPNTTQNIWNKHNYHETIEEHYDEVLVIGDQSIFDLPKAYCFPSSVTNKTSFCGYIKRSIETHSSLSKNQTPKKHQKQIVVAAGGGNDGKTLIELYLDSLLEDDFPPNIKHHIILGPEMAECDTQHLITRANEFNNVTIDSFHSDFISLLQHADLVISMAGYNTVCELLSCETPAILIPRVKPVQEQLIRAQCLANIGLFDYLSGDDLSPPILTAKIRHQLTRPQPSVNFDLIDQRGMETLEDKILSHLT